MRIIRFSFTKVHGSVPSGVLQSMPQLEKLDLVETALEGELPFVPMAGRCDKLQRVATHLSVGMTGDISDWVRDILERCPNVDEIAIGDCGFHGTLRLPTSPHVKLREFSIAGLDLEGTLPANFGKLFPSLVECSISRNKLSGNFPPTINEASNLEILTVSGNQVSFVFFSLAKDRCLFFV